MAKDNNFQKRLKSHLALLYDRKTGESGSGVLTQFGNRCFVLTAAHVISESLHINLGLSFHSSPMTIVDHWTDERLDIAFLELKPFEIEIYRHDEATPFKVGRKTIAEIPMGKKRFALYGYPYNQRKQVDERVAFIPLFLGCILLPFEKWPEFVREKRDPKLHFAIPCGTKHGSQFLDEDGKPMEIYPSGMSGCGLWFYDPTTEQSNKPIYSLLGIQHSHFPQDEVLSGTYIESIFDTIVTRHGAIPDDSTPAAH